MDTVVPHPLEGDYDHSLTGVPGDFGEEGNEPTILTISQIRLVLMICIVSIV